MKSLSVILTLFICVFMFSGCSKVKTAVVNMQSAMKVNDIMPVSNATMNGRTIKFGGDTNDNFGPSFDFNKLQTIN